MRLESEKEAGGALRARVGVQDEGVCVTGSLRMNKAVECCGKESSEV
jgi:hypothetical protein